MLSQDAKLFYLAHDSSQQWALLIHLMNIMATQKEESLSEKLCADKQWFSNIELVYSQEKSSERWNVYIWQKIITGCQVH
jgi:hypothetical protein